MKLLSISFVLFWGVFNFAQAEAFNSEAFAKNYFNAWAATQSPSATKDDVEYYLSLLTEDIGHQHLPYDKVDERDPEGKNSTRKGMNYYLGLHTEYKAKLLSYTIGYDVIVIKYHTLSKGIHPESKQEVSFDFDTVEILEIENGKVSVVRKYSE